MAYIVTAYRNLSAQFLRALRKFADPSGAYKARSLINETGRSNYLH